jgi:acylphosphatase
VGCGKSLFSCLSFELRFAALGSYSSLKIYNGGNKTIMVATRFYISGHVQGVSFRASARAEAERLGMSGWARNLADGRVEVLAMGSAAELIEMAMWLEQGPPGATVVAIASELEISTDHEGLQGFRTL